MRSLLPGDSSPRTSAVSGPVICQSGEVLSPWPVMGSLLAMEIILETGAESQLSEAETFTVIGTIWWFLCEILFGVAVTDWINGAVESTTLSPTVQAAELPAASVTVKERARNVAEQQKQAGADQIGGVARAVHGAAREIEQNMPQAAGFIHDAATRLEGAAASLRERSVDDLMRSLNDFARTQPAVFFGGALLAGFALSRFLKSSAEPSNERQS